MHIFREYELLGGCCIITSFKNIYGCKGKFLVVASSSRNDKFKLIVFRVFIEEGSVERKCIIRFSNDGSEAIADVIGLKGVKDILQTHAKKMNWPEDLLGDANEKSSVLVFDVNTELCEKFLKNPTPDKLTFLLGEEKRVATIKNFMSSMLKK